MLPAAMLPDLEPTNSFRALPDGSGEDGGHTTRSAEIAEGNLARMNAETIGALGAGAKDESVRSDYNASSFATACFWP